MVSFSVVLIARNEAKTLPRLVESLAEFQRRGGEIVLVDTGSTDDTILVARKLGCTAYGVGERFLTTITGAMAININRFFGAGEQPVVKGGSRLFDYCAARNYAASLASNDMVAMPDCDEAYTVLDLDTVERIIADGYTQLEYQFVFSHDAEGRPEIQFRHCKFYDRRKLHWAGVVHEVLQGEAERFYTDAIRLEHWQQPQDHRARYLAGLAYDCWLNPDNDRNSHYLGRELLWSGRPRAAIKELTRHIAMNRWLTERAQSMIFIGDAWLAIEEEDRAVEQWHAAFALDPGRREALLRLAQHWWKKGDRQRTACYAAAALEIPWSDFYANHMEHYRELPHELLYWAKWWLGDREGSAFHWRKALAFQPAAKKILHDARFYINLPRVSIIVPTLGRQEKLERLLAAIEAHANYPDYEVIVKRDSFIERQGVPRLLKEGVEESTGELVMFLGNDCVPEEGFLIVAVLQMLESFPQLDGLVALNDGQWHGVVATHWLAGKKLLPYIGGEFFHLGYRHVGCDNELTERAKALGKYVWCERARVRHEHFSTGAEMDEVYALGWEPESVAQDRALLAQRLTLVK